MNKLKGRKIEAKKSFYLVHLLYDGNFQKYPNFFKPVLQTGLTHKGKIIVGISQWKFGGGGVNQGGVSYSSPFYFSHGFAIMC